MLNEKPVTIEKLLKDHKQNKTTLGILKDEQESRQTTGKSILMGTIGKSKQEIDEEIYLLGKRIKIIDDALNSLPELQRKIIQRQLIDDEPYFIVCAELHMSEGGARKLKKRALAALERIMPRN